MLLFALSALNVAADDCVNNDSTSDSYGDTCSSYYDSNPGACGSADDDDFTASEQCCACAANDAPTALPSTAAPTTSAPSTPVPSSSPTATPYPTPEGFRDNDKDGVADAAADGTCCSQCQGCAFSDCSGATDFAGTASCCPAGFLHCFNDDSTIHPLFPLAPQESRQARG